MSCGRPTARLFRIRVSLLRMKTGIGETEVIQKIDNLGCVFARRSNQDTQISCVARPSVESQAVRAHDHVINIAGV
jgi:hypothetical protein